MRLLWVNITQQYDVHQIRELVKKISIWEAMAEIEEMDFEKIPSIADIYLFADIFS